MRAALAAVRTAGGWIASIAISLPIAAGQQDTPSPTGAAEAPSAVAPIEGQQTLDDEVAAALPTLEDVAGRLEELAGSEDEQALVTRGKLEAIQDLLQTARDARAQAAADREEALEAPQRIQVLEAQLAEGADAALPPVSEDSVPDDAALDDLRQEREDADARAKTLRTQLDTKVKEQKSVSELLLELPTKRSEADERVSEARSNWLANRLSADPSSPLRTQELAAEVDAAQALLDRLRAQRELLTARDPLLTVQRARLERDLQQADARADFYADLVAEREKAAADAAARRAEQDAEAIADRFPTLAEYQRQTAARIAQQRDSGRREEERRLEAVLALEDELNDRAATTRLKVAVSGVTEGIGLLLRREYDDLLALEPQVRGARGLRELNSRDQVALVLAKEELVNLIQVDAAVDALLIESGIDDPQEVARFRAEARTAVEARRAALQELEETLEEVTDLELRRLVALRDVEALYDDYFDFVSGEILWVPSTVGGRGFDLSDLRDAALWLIEPSRWQRVGKTLLGRASQNRSQVAVALLLVVVSSVFRARLRQRIQQLGGRVRSFRTDAYLLTLRALLLTVVVALPLPLAMWLVGDLGRETASDSLLLEALAAGLRRMAPVAFTLVLVRLLVMKGGVGEVHFRWPAKACSLLRHQILLLELVVLPTGVLFQLFDAQPRIEYNDTLGRIAFVIAMGALLFFSWRVLHPGRGVLAEAFARSQDTVLYRTRKAWFTLALALPAAHLLLALAAYYYTAQQLELRLEASLALALVLVILNGLLQRWLFITRRKLAVDQARKRAQERRDAESEERVSEAGIRIVDEDEVDIPALDLQTRRLFRSGITLSALVGLYMIWASALPALGGLDRVQVWPSLAIIETDHLALEGELWSVASTTESAAPTSDSPAPKDAGSAESRPTEPSAGSPALTPTPLPPLTRPAGEADDPSLSDAVVTLADVALAALILLVVSIAARNIPALLEISLLQRLPMDSGSRFAVSTLVRYLILVAGASSAFGALGVGWDKVQWLAAALTFGLAFGLQEIFANFVSGIIILIERPVRIGDIVTVGNTEGTVTRLRMRATTIMDWDRRELLVPNKEFITGSIVNWTLTDPVTRIRLDVGVAYGSDTEQARELLIAAARDCEYVLDDPIPKAWFMGFGDSTLNLRLLCFIATRDVYFTALNELHGETDRRFKEAGLEIAFPQRDLHLRSAPGLEGLRPDSDPTAPADG